MERDFQIEDQFTKLLSSVINLEVQCYKSIESTRNEAKKIKSEKLLITAEVQTGGVGRRGNIWESGRGGLWFNYAFLVNETNLNGITQVISLWILEILEDVYSSPKLYLKWPNDILLHDGKKLAGIMVESFNVSIDNNINRQVLSLGIGINVNNDVPEIGVNLKKILNSSAEINVVLLCSELLQKIEREIGVFKEQGLEFFRKRYLKSAYKLNEVIEIKDKENVNSGIYEDIDILGGIILNQSGIRNTFYTGVL